MVSGQRHFPTYPVALLIGLVILVSMVVASLVLSRTLAANTAEAARLSEYRRAVTDLLGNTRDAEIGQRGYLLTGDARYLEPYMRAVGNIDPALSRIASEGRARGQQVAHRLRPIVDDKLAELARTIALKKKWTGRCRAGGCPHQHRQEIDGPHSRHF